MKLQITILLLFPAFLTFTSCKKNCKDILVDQALKDYCMFKPGTWWVFQNDSTLARDTIIIESITNEVLNLCNEDINANYETINCYGKLRGKAANIGFYPEYDEVLSWIEDTLFRHRIWPTVRLDNPNGPVMVLDSESVNGHIFKDVLVFGAIGISEQHVAKNAYWIKSVDTRDSTSYSLVDFHIIQ